MTDSKNISEKINFYYHDIFLKHLQGVSHPESPDRLRSVMNFIQKDQIKNKLDIIQPKPADIKWIHELHLAEYVEKVKNSCGPNPVYLDPDTIVTQHSYLTALYAAGAVVDAVDSLMTEKFKKHSFCAVRPPGHHAEFNSTCGFCLFNNIAVGANYAIQKYGVEKIFILDWDVHHGNGTQHMFYNRRDVYFCSLHQWPLFPGTGEANETGKEEGKGYNLNIPLAPGINHTNYIALFEEKVLPAIEQYRPDLIMISCGFDAHKDEPLANLSLTNESYKTLTKLIVQLAKSTSLGKIISVLEGGYNLTNLPELIKIHLNELSMN